MNSARDRHAVVDFIPPISSWVSRVHEVENNCFSFYSFLSLLPTPVVVATSG